MADILNKWKNSLERTRKVAFGRLANFFGATEISIDTWDELEFGSNVFTGRSVKH